MRRLSVWNMNANPFPNRLQALDFQGCRHAITEQVLVEDRHQILWWDLMNDVVFPTGRMLKVPGDDLLIERAEGPSRQSMPVIARLIDRVRQFRNVSPEPRLLPEQIR